MFYCSRERVTIITASGLSFTTKLDENSLLFGSFIPFGTDQMSSLLLSLSLVYILLHFNL